ncbi:MAG TPA: SDR family NAD(P)-dependent oxidoreductase [Acidisoma sp.]|jgi:NAD(P)-dependent dehydrogenase (short-subunit alcohol dehydrogenase family)|uniref:SDR family NAD(P)-dependent oxidoreductase n=1 Tax=Acidisoma sp. TaxID=1872115 RepID=UPI002B702DEF|nr:SDR family NAD(P)-dependent oxidoreductase [Acidisoma sp.]HTH99913.1 SDR family NAD(P)-dependent oxidoreductase [Acidisoma sp.]
MKLSGMVAVVTGGASGQGEASCRLFAAEGAHVVVADWNGEGAARVASEIGGVPFTVDVAQEEQVAAMVDFACRTYGKLDVLFNNAGVGYSSTGRFKMASIVETPGDAWDAILAINLKGQAMGCKYAIPRMLEGGGGAIINNASIMAIAGIPGADAYTAAKGGVIALTRTLAVDWASRGIRVNCICPGTIETPMVGAITTEEDRARLGADTPMKRVGQAQEIAHAALYLASSDSSYVNGVILPVDGGWSAL